MAYTCQSAKVVIKYMLARLAAANTRFPEHLRYIITNNPLSAYVLQILNNQHHYRPMGNTMDFIESALKGWHKNCIQNFYTQRNKKN
jgi:hypothetical protein